MEIKSRWPVLTRLFKYSLNEFVHPLALCVYTANSRGFGAIAELLKDNRAALRHVLLATDL